MVMGLQWWCGHGGTIATFLQKVNDCVLANDYEGDLSYYVY